MRLIHSGCYMAIFDTVSARTTLHRLYGLSEAPSQAMEEIADRLILMGPIILPRVPEWWFTHGTSLLHELFGPHVSWRIAYEPVGWARLWVLRIIT